MKLSLITRSQSKLPRLLVMRGLAVSFALSGCVPATTYEQATSAAEVEREGHRRAAIRLSAAEEELKRVKAEKEALAAEKKDLEARLAKEETELAQTSLDMESAQKAHEQQSELVTQLRGELARVGDHLKAFQGDKVALSEEVSAAEKKVKLLEEQVAYLRSKAEMSEDAQEKLRASLADLDKMQGAEDDAEVQAPEDESTEDQTLPDAEEGPSDDGQAKEGEEPVDEVMPEGEASDDGE